MPWGISKEHNFIFVHIPKTAGCAICHFLKDHMEVGSNHGTISEIRDWCKAYNIAWEPLRPFAVIRNPIDRFALGYLFEQGKRVFRNVGESEIQKQIQGGNMALMPQTHWIDQSTRLIKYENLVHGLNGFLKDVGISMDAKDMPVVHSIGIEERFDDYFTEENKRIIRNVYNKDFYLWEGLKC